MLGLRSGTRCDYTKAAHGDIECRRIAERYGCRLPCHRFEPPAPLWRQLLADLLGRITR